MQQSTRFEPVPPRAKQPDFLPELLQVPARLNQLVFATAWGL
jgi:hypothetical protein